MVKHTIHLVKLFIDTRARLLNSYSHGDATVCESIAFACYFNFWHTEYSRFTS